MARTNNLTNFLTDVASAIKTKKGDSTPISASDFDIEIANLPTGGGDEISSDKISTIYNPTTATSSPITYANASRFLPTMIIKEVPKMTIDFTDYVSLGNAFHYCMGLEKIDVSEWDVSTITFFRGMFYGCINLKEIDLSNWDVNLSLANSCSITLMFKGCYSLKRADLSGLKGTANIGELMGGCTSLQFLDIRGLDIANCQNATTSGSISFLYSSGTPTPTSLGGYVPHDCEIIVADQTQKDWMTTNLPEWTNVKTVAEYENE